MTYWGTQITQVMYFWKDLFKMPAGSSIMDWKEFYMNKSLITDTFSMYHLLANMKTISLMAYLWISQSCWGDYNSIFPMTFWFLNLKWVLKGSGPGPGSGDQGSLGVQCCHWKDLLGWCPSPVQRVFAWKGWQGQRSHMGCNETLSWRGLTILWFQAKC